MSSQRLHHLDALRSFAILYGILVHAATIGVPAPFRLISEVSGHFRMAAFFLVSGYLSAMVLARLGTGTFLKRRAMALLVPLVFGVILLNPVTNWLIYTWHNGPMGFFPFLKGSFEGSLSGTRGPMVWHLHLWFLVSLAIYAVLTPVAVSIGRRWRFGLLADALASLPGWLVVVIVAGGVAASTLGLRTVYEIALDPLIAGLPGSHLYIWLVRITLYYAAFFGLGVGLFHHPALLDKLQGRPSLPAITLGIGFALADRSIDLQGLIGQAFGVFAKVYLMMTLVAALLAIFHKWFSGPGILSSLAGYIYSIYILHFLVIYLVAYALTPLGLSQEWLFCAVVVTAIPAVFALHRFVVAPSPILSFLFNGKPLAARRSEAIHLMHTRSFDATKQSENRP